MGLCLRLQNHSRLFVVSIRIPGRQDEDYESISHIALWPLIFYPGPLAPNTESPFI